MWWLGSSLLVLSLSLAGWPVVCAYVRGVEEQAQRTLTGSHNLILSLAQ